MDRGGWRDGREWTAQVRPAKEESTTSESVEGYDMPSLIELSGATEIDLLKIDIERSELELFARNTESWLPRIRNLCIELHGADCEAVLFRALAYLLLPSEPNRGTHRVQRPASPFVIRNFAGKKRHCCNAVPYNRMKNERRCDARVAQRKRMRRFGPRAAAAKFFCPQRHR